MITGRVPLLLLAGFPLLVWRLGLPTLWGWVGLVLVLTVADRLLTPSPQRLRFARDDVGSVRLDEPCEAVLEVANPTGRRARGVLRDAWQPSAGAEQTRHRLDLRSGARREVVTPLRPARRGDLLAAGVTVRLRGPLGLAARQHTAEVGGVVRGVPPFGSRRHLPERLQRLREMEGRTAIQVRGQGTEFDSLREYVRGDDVRSIDWRASARNRAVVVRTWQPERDRRVILVLDTSRTSAVRVGDAPRLDAAMDTALLVGALASRAGDRVELLAGDSRVRARMRAPGARDLTARMQHTMADLDPVIAEADWELLAASLARLGRRRALVVLLTALDSSAVEEGLLPVLPTLTSQHKVVVASVADPALARADAAEPVPGVEEVYREVAVERTLRRRARTAQALRALGADVVEAAPDRLPPAVADHYLALKARGML